MQIMVKSAVDAISSDLEFGGGLTYLATTMVVVLIESAGLG